MHLGRAFSVPPGLELLPTAALHSPNETLIFNFGAAPFAFDLAGFVRKERNSRYIQALSSPVASQDVLALVRSYCLHKAYTKTYALLGDNHDCGGGGIRGQSAVQQSTSSGGKPGAWQTAPTGNGSGGGGCGSVRLPPAASAEAAAAAAAPADPNTSAARHAPRTGIADTGLPFQQLVECSLRCVEAHANALDAHYSSALCHESHVRTHLSVARAHVHESRVRVEVERGCPSLHTAAPELRQHTRSQVF
mmetsp:Transcript_28673/g.67197  ORF Transcript_28673/g.67197 Transcript_28673/m.67197 type:complete len:249 (+) Transcript_28673:573-1319(+)